MLRVFVICCLIFQLTPLGGELAEAAFAHVSEANGRSPTDQHDADHGCTSLMHHCSCCRAIHATDTRIGVEIQVPDRSPQSAVFVLSRPHAEPDASSLLRPPTA